MTQMSRLEEFKKGKSVRLGNCMKYIAIIKIKIYTDDENPTTSKFEAQEKLEKIVKEIPNSYIESLDSFNDILKGDV